jgi:lipopolysaccharide export system permease protein
VFLLGGGILHRMIFWELVRVFALALTSLTGLFLIALVVQQATQLGLSLWQTLAALPLLVPYTLPYTIPATTLFAACVVYGRLSKDNEAVALKAAGVDLLTALRPAVVLGLLATAATFALAHSVIPRAQVALQAQLLKDPEEVLYNMLRRERIFRAGTFPYVIHVKDVQGRRLVDVVLKRRKMARDGSGKEIWTGVYDFVVRAREARLRVDLTSANPTLYIDPDRWVGEDGNLKVLGSANEPLGVPLPDIFNPKEARDRPINMDWDELPAKAAEFRGELAKTLAEQAAARRAAAAEPDPAVRKRHEDNVGGLQYVVEHLQRQIRSAESEYYLRPALALGCLVFAVVGVPVGMWANRADYLSSFVTCFLPTVFVYYPLMLAGRNMAQDGKLPMLVGVFLADAVGGVLAVVLVRRLIAR